MAEERVQRRLAAILAADVVGYSRLMEVDEAGTRARLRSLQSDLIEPQIAADGGRIVKTSGDGILVEFGSAVDAVRNALGVQWAMQQHNVDVPEERRIEFRVGINLGDVIVEGDDIHGDGVNVAARLEGLCGPGEVYVSGTVHDHVEGKLAATFDDLGEQSVKNIAKLVRVYRVREVTDEQPSHKSADAPLSLPDKPSIAVLPFENMSGDPEQEYFADGMAEDIITALSHFRWFFVIARNSSFTYKGRAVDVRTVGRELGARYVLEGSVRKGGNRLRINAQLIETETGNHLWAEKYDGALEDVFDLQDHITEGVAGAIEPSLRQAEVERARRKRPENLDAYDLYLRALPHAWAWAPAEQEKSVELLEAALEIDPHYVAAHGLLAWSYSTFVVLDPSDSRRDKSVQHARAVLGPNTDDSLALAFASFALALFERDYDAALSAVDRALSLTPNSPTVLAYSAASNAFAGHFDTAIEQAQASLRLSPFDPLRFTAEVSAGYGYFFSGRYHDAAEAALRCIHINPQFLPGYPLVVASRIREDRAQDARQAVERLLGFKPDFRVSEFIRVGRFSPDLNEAYAAALREAGLPE
jgi:TolB-like protein/Tfp pilus assembly protein PilF